jgi:uncharacterized protein YndB with AHSA1/START domain
MESAMTPDPEIVPIAPATRSVTLVVPIAAAPRTIWRALTDPAELVRWFSLRASVVPGPGGQMSLRWDEHSADEMPILAWDPERHLSVGMAKPPGAPPPAQVITDFLIEPHADGRYTTLRVVAHGFDADARWDQFFDGIRRGWRHETQSLRHYLERHPGRERHAAWARHRVAGDATIIWSALAGPRRMAIDGSRYRWTAPDGTIISGDIRINEPPLDFTGTVDGWRDGLLRIQLEPARGAWDVACWLSAYRVEPDRVMALQSAWQTALDRLAV